VLVSMGLDAERIAGAIRMSWSHVTDDPDWDEVVQRIRQLQG
jgi:cysteine desulfurase